MYDVPKHAAAFRLNNVMYIIVFAIYRIPMFLLLGYCLLLDRHRMPAILNYAFLTCDVVMIYLNFFFFKKLITSDHLFE